MTGLLRPAFRPAPLVLFALLAVAIVAVEYAVVHRADFGQRPALPPAVALDLLLTLPGVFYLCVVRPYRLPLRTLAGAFGVGLALSHWLLPAAGLPLLAWAGRLAAVGEVATIGYALGRLRRGWRGWRGYRLARAHSADFMENLTAALRPGLGRLTEAMVTEIAVFRYALLGGWARPEVGPAETPFSTYRTSGFAAMLTTLAGLSAVEMAAAHLVAGHWWPRGAWLLTGLGAYSLLWLLAHGQAVRRRPVLLTATTLVVRVGFGWRVAIPVAQVRRVQKITDVPAAAPGLLNAARLLLTPPNILLTLAEPLPVRGLYGTRRLVRHLAIYVDEPAALTRQLIAAAPAA